jgi:hypothetical protein
MEIAGKKNRVACQDHQSNSTPKLLLEQHQIRSQGAGVLLQTTGI